MKTSGDIIILKVLNAAFYVANNIAITVVNIAMV